MNTDFILCFLEFGYRNRFCWVVLFLLSRKSSEKWQVANGLEDSSCSPEFSLQNGAAGDKPVGNNEQDS